MYSALALCPAFLAAPSLVFSQTTMSAVAAARQAKQSAVAESVPLFSAHNFSAAETMVEAANLSATGTPAWNIESGTSLLKMVIYFHNLRDTATVAGIAPLALRQFALAEAGYSAATKASDIAAEKETVGYIYEKLLGDRMTAQQYYAQAVALDPNNRSAARGLDRLTRSLAEEEEKQ